MAILPVLPSRHLRLFDLNGLRGNPDDDVVRLDVARDYRARSDHGVVSDLCAGQNSRVIRDTDAVSNRCARSLDFVDVVDVVIMGIDVDVV